MSWHIEQKKDAVNGETPRGDVNSQRSGGIRMGKPDICNEISSANEYIVREKATQGIETSQYLEEKKTKVIPRVVASEIGEAQTSMSWGSRTAKQYLREQSNGIERPAEGGASPVDEISKRLSGILSTTEHVELCRKQPGPSGKAKYSYMTDSEPVP